MFLVVLFPLRRISVSDQSYFDGKYNTQVLGEYEVRNFNGGTLNVKGGSETLSTDIMKALENVEAPKHIDNSLKASVFIKEEVDNSIPSRIREDLALYSFWIRGKSNLLPRYAWHSEKFKSRRN